MTRALAKRKSILFIAIIGLVIPFLGSGCPSTLFPPKPSPIISSLTAHRNLYTDELPGGTCVALDIVYPDKWDSEEEDNASPDVPVYFADNPLRADDKYEGDRNGREYYAFTLDVVSSAVPTVSWHEQEPPDPRLPLWPRGKMPAALTRLLDKQTEDSVEAKKVEAPTDEQEKRMQRISLEHTGIWTGPASYAGPGQRVPPNIDHELNSGNLVWWRETIAASKYQVTILVPAQRVPGYLRIKASTSRAIQAKDMHIKHAPHRMGVIGDSVAWGQGLEKRNKYYYGLANRIANTIKRPVIVQNFAHSGAIIGSSKYINLVSTNPTGGHYHFSFDFCEYIERWTESVPVEQGSQKEFYYDTHSWYDSVETLYHRLPENLRALYPIEEPDAAYAGEVPCGTPTLWWQLKSLTECGEPERIDVVIAQGGLHDFGVNRILTESSTLSISEAQIHTKMKELLKCARISFPNASVIVPGYHHLISDAPDIYANYDDTADFRVSIPIGLLTFWIERNKEELKSGLAFQWYRPQIWGSPEDPINIAQDIGAKIIALVEKLVAAGTTTADQCYYFFELPRTRLLDITLVTLPRLWCLPMDSIGAPLLALLGVTDASTVLSNFSFLGASNNSLAFQDYTDSVFEAAASEGDSRRIWYHYGDYGDPVLVRPGRGKVASVSVKERYNQPLFSKDTAAFSETMNCSFDVDFHRKLGISGIWPVLVYCGLVPCGTEYLGRLCVRDTLDLGFNCPPNPETTSLSWSLKCPCLSEGYDWVTPLQEWQENIENDLGVEDVAQALRAYLNNKVEDYEIQSQVFYDFACTEQESGQAAGAAFDEMMRVITDIFEEIDLDTLSKIMMELLEDEVKEERMRNCGAYARGCELFRFAETDNLPADMWGLARDLLRPREQGELVDLVLDRSRCDCASILYPNVEGSRAYVGKILEAL